MEFNLLRKISAYTTGISFFVTTIINSIFLCISGYMKYIKKEEQLKSDRKIEDVLEKFYIRSYLLTLILFILAIIFWWKVLVWYATPAS